MVMVPIMKKRIEKSEDEEIVTYLKAADNTLYDFNSHEEIGIWNPKAKKYILLNGNNLQNLQAINELLNQIEEIHVECECCSKKTSCLLCEAEEGKIDGFDKYGVWWCEACRLK